MRNTRRIAGPLVLALSLSLALSSGAPAAHADELNAERPREWKLGLVQAGAALGASFGLSALAFALAEHTGGDVTLGILAAAPLTAGVTVCALGTTSRYNESSCWPSVAAPLLTVPVVLTMLLANSHPDPERQMAMAATWVLLPPILATTAWHLFKRPRPAPVAAFAAPSPRRLALAQPRRRGSTPSGQLVLPLLATSF